MRDITLLASTGSARADAVVREVLARMRAACPGRLRAAYVLGSYADASAMSTSDLDLTLIVRGAFQPEGAERLRALAAEVAAAAPVELDIELKDAASLADGASPTLKLGSRHLWGEDVLAEVSLVPLAVWTRDRMHSSYWRLGGLFARPRPLAAPLAYPDPDDEFYGYCRRPIRLPDGREVPGTRDLIRAVGWMATALLAHQVGWYVARKSECAPMYRQHLGGEWAPLVVDVARWVRQEWRYLIPGLAEERARLRAICARTLDFENHFLAIYRPYLLGELASADVAARAWALEALEHMPLADAAVSAAASEARAASR